MDKIILVGKSCAGKTFFRNKLEEQNLVTQVSYTTRPPRQGEENGIDYHFVTPEEFEEAIGTDFFLEHQSFNGWYYGTPVEEFKIGLSDVFVMNPGGIKFAIEKHGKDIFKDALIVYLDIENGLQKKRLLERNDSNDSADRRMIADQIDFKDFVDWDIRLNVTENNLKKINATIDNLVKVIK